MKITSLFLLIFCLHVSASTVSQTITFSGKEVPLQKVFSVIEQQSGFLIVYNEGMLKQSKPVTVDVKDILLTQFLQLTLEGQGLSFLIENKTIILKVNETTGEVNNRLIIPPPPITVRGRIVNEKGEPVIASVTIKGTKRGTTTDENGVFELSNVEDNAVLIISGTSIELQQINVAGRTSLNISATTKVNAESEVVVSGGYYTTTNKLKTGSISKVTSKDIENQPVTSPFLALQGRMSGVEISPTSGAPGSAVNIQIRGQNSLRTGIGTDRINGNLPLYIIDGNPITSIPLFSNSESLMRDGYDPLSTINPNDIESIEILKDADATAIYGSRGANGVIIVKTKNRKNLDQPSLDANIYKGIGQVVNRVKMLSAEEYLKMRHEAVNNDGGNTLANYQDTAFRSYYFPDLFLWDTTRYTDWQDFLFGNHSNITDINLNLSGGSQTTAYNFGIGYHNESLLYPSDFGYKRYTSNLNVSHISSNKRLNVSFSTNFGVNTHKLFNSEQLFFYGFTMPPNAPQLYDERGELNWEPVFGISTWVNPLSFFRSPHKSNAYNLVTNGTLSYQLKEGFSIRLNSGFTMLNQLEKINTTISSMNPNVRRAREGRSRQNMNERISWIVEPQVNFDRYYRDHRIIGLVGATAQQATSNSSSFLGTGYTSDALLGALSGARTLTTSSNESQYRYTSAFARVGYEYKRKYIINLTARRDGSSRFGPGKRFGNFGAIGAAWIFSSESLFDNNVIMSFGKIRASYGKTGNDQIGDSKYLKTYSIGLTTYNNEVSLMPTGLFNSDYAWEVTRKLEGALEMGFLKDLISVEFAWYRNRSSNQLVEYQLPAQSGFQGVLSNFNATIQNRGIEGTITSRNITTKKFKWVTSFNITKSDNKLIAFPGIETSSYKEIFKVGEPLSIQYTYIWKGVDPNTGLHTFEDINKDNVLDFSNDKQFTKALKTNYFGGINNIFSFNGIELSFLFQFSDRLARAYYPLTPGTQNNQPASALGRWKKAGDITNVQRFTTTITPYGDWTQSDGVINNVFFVRLKTLNLSYTFSPTTLKSKPLRNARVFLQGQNLLTFGNFDGWDPETLWGIPPMRILSLGVDLKF